VANSQAGGEVQVSLE